MLNPPMTRRAALGGFALTWLGTNRASAEVVSGAEADRVAVIKQVTPAVAAVCFFGGKVCGSGVVIDPEGYCLTNFHVVQPTGPIMQCGLADGELYDTVLVGTDKVGDVSLVKLMQPPGKEGKPFPYVKLADSDKVQAGDWSLAMGNPFGLALDFTPTVTYGLVSGVNRYQPPEGKGTLEYTDCIQIDTSINPGNSGGPLFNMKGELIGINGRGSFDKRTRINSGVGYAISINQIKHFLGHLRAGIDTDHATLGAEIRTENEDGDLSKMVVGQVLQESDAYRRGLKSGDQLVTFAGRPMSSTNQFKNVLGIYPAEWRLPLSYRRNNVKKEMLVRLMGLQDVAVEKPDAPKPPAPGPGPRPGPGGPGGSPAMAKSPANKLYEAKKGFANYYFNKLAQDALLGRLKKSADLTAKSGIWVVEGRIALADRQGSLKLEWKDDKDGLTEVSLTRENAPAESLVPLKGSQSVSELQLPAGSGGLLAALYQFRILFAKGRAGFERQFVHAGHEPCYPPRADGKEVDELKDLRVDCEVIKTKHATFDAKWFFDLPKDGKPQRLVACESYVSKEDDPCELYFGDYKTVDGKELPHRIEVRFADKKYAVLTLSKFDLK